MENIEETKELLQELLKQAPHTLQELADELEMRRGDVLNCLDDVRAKQKGMYFYLGSDPKDVPNDEYIQSLTKVQNLTRKNKKYAKENKRLREEVDSLYRSVSINNSLEEKSIKSDTLDLKTIDPVKVASNSPKKSEQTILIALSDWHIGETVKAETVNYVNSFDYSVARERLRVLFSSIYDRIVSLSKSHNPKQILLWLGGDLMGGYIHEELMEENCLSPEEEANVARDILVEALEGLATLGFPIKVICNWGNHGRTTSHKKFSTAAANNNEWLLYKNVESIISRSSISDLVDWHTSKSYYAFADVYGYRMRFHHGDNIKISPSSNFVSSATKKLKALDDVMASDFDVFGHFHSLTFNRRFLCNGSVIGPNGFSHNLGFPNEAPKQAMMLIDSQYGFDCDMIPLRLA